MDLDQLRTFAEVATRRSFSRAATALHVTQPAVSKRISTLEQHLGAPLFDRVGRVVLLTQAGSQLLPVALDILQRLNDAAVSVKNSTGAIGGPLAIATSHHVGLHRLPQILRAFTARHPEVQLQLRFEDSEVAHELVRTGASELAVVTLDPVHATALAYVPLWTDVLRFVACPEHPLTGAPIRLAELCEHPAILPGPSTYTGRIISALFAGSSLELNITMSTNYLETIRMLAAIGLGWTALPETMIDASLASLQVTDAPVLSRELGCVLHPERTLSNAARAFMALIAPHTAPPADRPRLR